MDSKIFGKLVREGLKETGMSASQLSREAHISPSSITQYCNGYVLPTPENRRVICSVLGIEEPEEEQPEKDKKSRPEHPDNMSVEEAAWYLGKSPLFVRIGLRTGILDFGYAVEMPGGHYSYWIGRRRFFETTRLEEKEGWPN